MRERGLARTTTKEIARAAQLSEPAMYRYFDSKEALFLAVLDERTPGLVEELATLEDSVGKNTVEQNVRRVVRAAAAFYERSVPMAASIFAEPGLLARHREALRNQDRGPHQPQRLLAAYLRAEQDAARIDQQADTDAVAALLLGACFQQAFLNQFLQTKRDDRFSDRLVATMMNGLA